MFLMIYILCILLVDDYTLYFIGFMLRCTMLYTYSICTLLAIRQVLYPLGCFKTLYGFTECKINE